MHIDSLTTNCINLEHLFDIITTRMTVKRVFFSFVENETYRG